MKHRLGDVALCFITSVYVSVLACQHGHGAWVAIAWVSCMVLNAVDYKR